MLEILDCTIRDGGYYTNWDFDKELVSKYIQNINKLPVDYVEIGYRNPAKDQAYFGEYFHLNSARIIAMKAELKDAKVALMLDAKSVENDQVEELLNSVKEAVDLVRIAVNPDDIERSIELGRAISKTGLPIAFNVMYISVGAVTDDLIKTVLNCGYDLEYFYLVDSYGGATPEMISELVTKLKSSCAIKIGFHGHNNLEMAMANTLAAIEAGVDIIDATVTGMGRGAGNLKTELLLTYLLKTQNRACDMEALGELVNIFKPLHNEFKWGTNLPYMMSGAMNIPQGMVMNWISTDRYSENDIVKKVVAMGNNEQTNLKTISLSSSSEYSKVLIIGGGNSIDENSDKITQLIQSEDYKIIFTSIKYLDRFSEVLKSFSLCVSGKQIHNLKLLNASVQTKVDELIVPSNSVGINESEFGDLLERSFVFDNVSYPDKTEDSPLLLAVEFGDRIKVEMNLVGFDGYANDTAKGTILNKVNQRIFDHYKNKNAVIVSLTRTTYAISKASIHALTM